MTDTSEAGKTVAVPEQAEVDGEVVEGVVVDEAAPVATLVHRLRVRSRSISVVVKHEHTKTAGRHLAYIPLGAGGGQAVVGLAHHGPLRAVHPGSRGQRQP